MNSHAVALTAALAFSSLAQAQQGMRQGEWRYWGGDAGSTLMIDGVLYTSAGVHQAAAIDPKTGTTLWVFTPDAREIAGRGGGGANWNGGAFDPETGMMYVPTRNQPMVAALTPADRSLTDFDYVRAATAVVPGPSGLQMPAIQAVLTEAQIHDVSEYVAAGLPAEPKQQ